MKIGIIGGSGAEKLFSFSEINSIETQFGIVEVSIGTVGSAEVIFIPRHGSAHDLLPHEVNYRANISAFGQLGTDYIISTSAVGSLHKKFKPGEFLLLNDFIDFSKQRVLSFFGGGKIGHADMHEPYSAKLNKLIKIAAKKITGNNIPEVVYVGVEGPRFETRSEIKMFQKIGGHVVGMTNVPEVVLANELGLPYSSLATVANFACGIVDGAILHEDVELVMAKKKEQMSAIIFETINLICKERG